MRLNFTTLAWCIECIIADSFTKIFYARLESLSLAIIFRALFSPVILFLTNKTTPKAPKPSRSRTENIFEKFKFSDYLSTCWLLIMPLGFTESVWRISKVISRIKYPLPPPSSTFYSFKFQLFYPGLLSLELFVSSSLSSSPPNIRKQSTERRFLRIFLICLALANFSLFVNFTFLLGTHCSCSLIVQFFKSIPD